MQLAIGQISDNNYTAIVKVLNSQSIVEKIFVKYGENVLGNGAFMLKPGKYAFICPNHVFANTYVGIIDMLPYTMATDSLLETKKFYIDHDKAIYVKAAIVFELFIAFTKLYIADSEGEVDFFTTSLQQDPAYQNNYVKVSVKLLKKDDVWTIVKENIEPIEWIDYFGFAPKKK